MAVMSMLVAVVHQLMSPCDLLQAIGMVELHGIVLSECPSSSSWTYIKTKPLIRVTPKQIANGSFTGHLLNSVKFSNVVQSFNVGRESTVSTKDLPLDNGREGEVVKEFGKHFPDVVIFILPHTLIIEAVVLSDASGFVVTS